MSIDERALATAFTEMLAERSLPAPDDVECRAIVVEWLRQAREAWPMFSGDETDFVRHCASVLSEVSAAKSLHAADLYLAFLCGKGDARAVEAFSKQYAADVRVAAERLRARERTDELMQLVWQKLFTNESGNPPKILEYSGRGKLQSWLRVIVVRRLVDEFRREQASDRARADHAVLSVPTPQVDPETAYLRELYSSEYQRAFEEAAQALMPEERNALRGYYSQGLNIDQLAAMFGIHRATAARRVKSARDNLLNDTRRRLARQLELSPRELSSIMRLLESQLQLSLSRVFRE